MVKKNTKIIQARRIEIAVMGLMFLFGIAAIVVFIFGLMNSEFRFQAMVIEMFLLILLAILAQTTILVKMLERLY